MIRSNELVTLSLVVLTYQIILLLLKDKMVLLSRLLFKRSLGLHYNGIILANLADPLGHGDTFRHHSSSILIHRLLLRCLHVVVRHRGVHKVIIHSSKTALT